MPPPTARSAGLGGLRKPRDQEEIYRRRKRARDHPDRGPRREHSRSDQHERRAPSMCPPTDSGAGWRLRKLRVMGKNLLSAVGIAAAVALLVGCGAAAAGITAAPKPAVTRTVTVRVTATPKPPGPPAAPAATTAPTVAPPAPQLVNAEALVTQYYQDITDQDYAAAWALGGPDLNRGTSYASWAAGYATTASISLGTFSS